MRKTTVKITEFTVTGRGRFPSDMLRYDRAWPKAPIDAENLNGQEERSVTLQAIGTVAPTHGRWKSFGWKITQEETRR